ncbi:MAG TPA: SDR family oxidoreductase [Microlunatus sp.]|nr:SDR family oxidoreductase [Microlunatus sp.]
MDDAAADAHLSQIATPDPTAAFRLSGRLALVTGASSGLGARVASTLNAAGAEIVLTGRDTTRLQQVADHLDGTPSVVPGDLRDAAFRVDLIDRVTARSGHLDVLVNGAGTCDNGSLQDQVLAELTDVIDLDLVAAIDLCRLAAPLLHARPGAAVINIASIFGQISSGGGMAAYHAAKGGLITFTRHLAEQWGERGVRVNAIAPGFFPTPLTGQLADPGQRRRIVARTLLRRTPDLGELDGPVLFLASDAASYVTGHVLVVDGGWTAN